MRLVLLLIILVQVCLASYELDRAARHYEYLEALNAYIFSKCP